MSPDPGESLFAFLLVLMLALPINGGTTPQTPQGNLSAYPPDVVADVVISEIVSYAAYTEAQAFGAWLVEVEAQKAAEEAQRAAQEALARRPVTIYQAPATAAQGASGDCYSGTPIPAYIIDRESGGNPNAVNPSSGAYGCYQLMPMHYNGGLCSDLGRDLAGQKACAQRLYDAAGLQPWAL